MQKVYFLFPRFVTLFVYSITLQTGFAQVDFVDGKWTGTVSLHQKYTGEVGYSDLWIDVSFSENNGTGTMRYEGEMIIEGKSYGKTKCNGSGPAELHHLSIDRSDSTFHFHVIGPEFTCTPLDAAPGQDARDITMSNRVNIGNLNLLSGSDTRVTDVGAGKITTTISWSLYRGPLDAVLIVTPDNYQNWLPKASPDELQKGTVMDIGLKLQARNGGRPSMKAVRFELQLSNTSHEPGTTLNTPLQPSANPLPDIRFLPHTLGESIAEDQSLTVESEDGISGKATLGCYDGGGRTYLSAVAILEGGFRVEGHLLVANGTTRISIPRINGSSAIAAAWLAANGNPGDNDDKENSGSGNTHRGDGLTAFEEYRGFFSKGQFRRLSPAKKELGLVMKRPEVSLFEEGISWFENATGIEIIPFDESEISADRRLNKNFLTAHDYDQYVMKLEKGPTNGAAGENRPVTLNYMLPRQSELVVINVDLIQDVYRRQDSVTRLGGGRVPFTREELLASTVAHELAHGVNVNHHGDASVTPQNRIAYEGNNPPFHIFDTNGREIPVSAWSYDPVLQKRSYKLDGTTGTPGNEESGDLSCIMAYTSNYQWSFHISQSDQSLNYYQVPLLPLGKKLCNTKTGTGINHPANRGVNNVNKYFGNAEEGECIKQLKLRD